MTIGENIRRIRQMRGVSVKDLAEMIGVSANYLRQYENGQRSPKRDGIERIAKALNVNPEVLLNAEFNAETAMHRLFHIFKAYAGVMYEADEIAEGINKDIDPGKVFISFDRLGVFLGSWYREYSRYKKMLSDTETIKDEKTKDEATRKAEEWFESWMDYYPESEPDQGMLEFARIMDQADDFIGHNPLNDEEYPMSEEEKAAKQAELKGIYSKLDDVSLFGTKPTGGKR